MISITAPSKTFLLGEYVALEGGPTLILTTEPLFQMKIKENSQGLQNLNGIHKESPAGKWMQQHEDFFQLYKIEFMDPHQGLGGFGASSAQFLMLYHFKHHIEGKEIQIWDLLQDYKNCAWNKIGIPPSGADVMAQLSGGVTLFHYAKKKLNSFSWPFPELEFCLIHTGHKLATHHHLRDFTSFDLSNLYEIANEGCLSIKKKNSQAFIDAINLYAEQLKREKMVSEYTQQILNHFKMCPDIRAAKGCGAMGADVVLVLYDKEKQKTVIQWLEKQGLHLVVYGQQAASECVLTG